MSFLSLLFCEKFRMGERKCSTFLLLSVLLTHRTFSFLVLASLLGRCRLLHFRRPLHVHLQVDAVSAERLPPRTERLNAERTSVDAVAEADAAKGEL